MVSTHLETTGDPTTQWIAAHPSDCSCQFGFSVHVSSTMPLPSPFWVESWMHILTNWFWCSPTSQRNVQVHEDSHPAGSAPNVPFLCLPLLLSCFTLRLATATCCSLLASGPTWLSGSHPGALSFPRVLHQCTPLFAANATLQNHLNTESPSNHFLRTCNLDQPQLSGSGLPSFCNTPYITLRLAPRNSCLPTWCPGYPATTPHQVWQTVPLQKVTSILHIVLPIPADSWRQSQAPTQVHLDLRSFSHLSSNVTNFRTLPLHKLACTLTLCPSLTFIPLTQPSCSDPIADRTHYSSPTLGVTIVAATGKRLRAPQLVIVLLLPPTVRHPPRRSLAFPATMPLPFWQTTPLQRTTCTRTPSQIRFTNTPVLR